MTAEEAKALRVSDFQFQYVPKTDTPTCKDVQRFIERHEWLGKMPTRPTHRFIATYKGQLAGVIVMATPNSFGNLLGPESRHLEKLISRGASISWAPKNLGSALIMYSIRWMVKHTAFRIFTAYSDTEARELGTIYQACNFIYLGQNSGARIEYFDPMNSQRGWFSDRLFRKSSQIKRYARELGNEWQPHWSEGDKIWWEIIPIEVRRQIKQQAKSHKARCQSCLLPPKHKYAYLLGQTKAETKSLKVAFAKINPHLANLQYPKLRGPVPNTAAKLTNKSEEILTTPKIDCRPQQEASDFEHLTVKEAAHMIGVSIWTIYKLIESDPSFPVHNVGLKKKFVISKIDLKEWFEVRHRRWTRERQGLLSGEDLLKIKGVG